ncbi:MAG TPA: glycosyltransferase family 39 protein, partial [Opitutus sp.]|nr:glycosyltransferase family 39 protein [Opitutus sp.]
MPAVSPSTRRWLVRLCVVTLLAVHAIIAITGKRDWSVTSDEIIHVLAGQAYWQLDDYRIQPENGNLPQRWIGLPAVLTGAHLPPTDDPDWLTSDQWRLGYTYLYASGNDADRLLMRARAINIIWSLACALLIFAWSRRLFGLAGGFVSLGFYCLDPAFIAHGALATSDVCMTFFMLASVSAWWRYLVRGSAGAAAVSAGIFALACVAKYSAVLLLPMFIVLIIVRALARRSPPLRAGRVTAVLLAHGAAAVFVIWASFGFRYVAAGPAAPPMMQFIRDWRLLIQEIGWQGHVLAWLRDWRLLPEAFLFGYNHVVAYAQQRAAFLDGNYSVHGWVWFFPLAFLYKTTLALLAALAGALLVTLRRWRTRAGVWREDLYRVIPLLVVVAVYGTFALASHLDIGHRHILPLYPVLFIFTGALGWWAARSAARAPRWALAGLFALAAVEEFSIHPHELAFFNALSGGPAQGYRHLVDSSLDWGQDLPGLARWLQAHPTSEPVYLSYFGTGEPGYYHIHARRLLFINGLHVPQQYVPLEPGVYCIGATMLQQVYSRVRGPWTLALEREYQDLRKLEPLFSQYEKD